MSSSGVALLAGYGFLVLALGYFGFKANGKKWARSALLISVIPAGVAWIFAVGLWWQSPVDARQAITLQWWFWVGPVVMGVLVGARPRSTRT